MERREKFLLALGMAITVLITFMDYHLWAQFHSENINELVMAAKGVVSGTPHWRAYQGRLLGPYAIYGVFLATNLTYTQAYTSVVAGLLFAWNALTFGVFTRLTGSLLAGVGCAVVGSVAFNRLHHYWFYPWDSFDLILFTAFVYFIYARKSLAWYIALFAIELTNREAALFIPVWIVLNSSDLGLRKIHSVLIAASLLIVGVVLIKFVRDSLWVTSMLPDVGDDLSHQAIGNHIYFGRNIALMVRGLKWPGLGPLSDWVMLGACLLVRIRIASARTRNLMVFTMVILGSVVFFGVADETRMYLIFIPLTLGILLGDNYSSDRRSAVSDEHPDFRSR